MLFPRARAWAFVALGLCFSGWCAEAGPSTRLTGPLTGQPVRYVTLPGGSSVPVCQLGEHNPPVDHANVVYFDDGDTYYTYLNVNDSCAACTSGTYAHVTAAHLALYFPFAPETLRVRVGVVGVNPIACRFQDVNLVVCAPFEQVLISQDALVTVDFTLPYPTECQIRTPPFGPGHAFVWFEFMTASDTTEAHKPRLAVQNAAIKCRTYNPIGFNQRIDFVELYEPLGNPIMYVDVEECLLTPVRRRSWGQLKLLYR